MNYKSLMVLTSLVLTGCSGDTWFGSEKKLEMSGEREPIFSKEVFNGPSIKKSNYQISNLTPLSQSTSGGYISNFTTLGNINAELDSNYMSFSLDSDSEFGMVSMPIVVNNKVIAIGADSRVTAFDRQSGSRLWSSKKTDDLSLFNFWNGSKFIGGGLGYSNGLIVATNGLSEVYCLKEEAGSEVWEAKLSNPTRANPLIVDDIAIVQTIDNKTYGLNIKDGSVVWIHQGFGDKLSTLAASTTVAYKEIAIVQYPSGDLYGIDLKTGQELWNLEVDEGLEVLSTKFHLDNFIPHPIVKDNYLFAYGADGMLAKFNLETGERLWQLKHGANKPIWISNQVIFATSNKTLKAIDSSDGAPFWEVNLNEIAPSKKPQSFSSPIVANSAILVASSEGKLLVFDASNGNLIEQRDILSNSFYQLVALEDGLYVLSKNGKLIRY